MFSFSPLLSDFVSVVIRGLDSDRTAVLVRPVDRSPTTPARTKQSNSGGDVSLVKVEININR